MRVAPTVTLVLALGGCGSPAQTPPPPAAERPAPAAAPPVALAPAAAPPATVLHHGLAWYERAEPALAEARRTGKPVLVDLWAPWCHTCLSMKNFVLTAANLPGVAERFVLLSINTEAPEAAAFLAKAPVSVWPTFYVYDAAADTPRGRWLGSASPRQFMQFLGDGEKSMAAAQAGGLPPGDPLALALAGDALATSGDALAAAAKFAEALTAAPADWPRRPDVLVARQSALAKAKDFAGCADLGVWAQQQTGNAVSAVDFASGTVSCAAELKPKTKLRDTALAVAGERLAPLCEVAGAAELTPDDRGEACRALAEAHELRGDAARAKAAYAQLLAVLEQAAAGVPDDVALTYDGYRTHALVELGRADEAVALMADRAKALPRSYLPPQYLARIHRGQKRFDLALAAYDVALGKAYGPRLVSLWSARAEVCREQADLACERRSLEGLVAAHAALPVEQQAQQAARLGQARERLGQLAGK